MEYKLEPFEWQKQAIARGAQENELGIFAETGCGKTCALINILRHRYSEEGSIRIKRTVIFSPIVTLDNWENEFEIHSHIPNGKIHNASNARQRLKHMKAWMNCNRDGIILLNYEAVNSKGIVDLLFEWGVEILVCDESHYVKNYKAQRSRKIQVLARQAKFRYLLTGTPFLNSVQDLYGQFKILDNGKTFGENFFIFRSIYMKDANANWSSRPAYFPNWQDNPDRFDELQGKVQAKSIRVLKSECLDLPPLIEQKIKVPLSPEQKKVYKELEQNCITFIKENSDSAVVAQTALTKLLRLQQVVSGFVKTEKDEEIKFKTNPRLDVLMEQVEVINRKIIIWTSFKKDVELISKALSEKNIIFETLTGNQSPAMKKISIANFRFEKNCQVLIANRRAGGIGINLVEAPYSIVYSRNFSLADEIQSKARNYRKGSEVHEAIVKIDLITPDTTDELAYNALINKGDVSKTIIDSIRRKT